MEGVLKDIEQAVIKNGGKASFDVWSGKTQTTCYRFLLNQFHYRDFNMFTGLKGSYVVKFEHGKNGVSNKDMGSPDAMVVEILKQHPING